MSESESEHLLVAYLGVLRKKIARAHLEAGSSQTLPEKDASYARHYKRVYVDRELDDSGRSYTSSLGICDSILFL